MADGPYPVEAPPNDAHLVQLVREALGRHSRPRGRQRMNVSSCSFVVTPHGTASSAQERAEIEAAARAVPGVSDVANKLRLTGP